MDLKQYSDYLKSRSYAAGNVISGTFELTARCTLSCRMCYIHGKTDDCSARSREIDGETWLKWAREAQEQGLLDLIITGGEPLLHRDFKEIYLGCRKLGILVTLNTNATLIDEEWVEFFRQNPPYEMSITLYGASEETYARLCGNGKAYGRVIKAIDMLRDAGIKMRIKFSAAPDNAADLPAVYEFARSRGLNFMADTYMLPTPDCPDFSRLTPEDSARAQWVYDSLRLNEDELKKRAKLYLDYTDGETGRQTVAQTQPGSLHCGAGRTTVWINYDGKMHACAMLPYPEADTLKLGFNAARDEVKEKMLPVSIPEKCQKCPAHTVCSSCAASAWAECGDYNAAPEYLCKRTEEYSRLCREYLEKSAEN